MYCKVAGEVECNIKILNLKYGINGQAMSRSGEVLHFKENPNTSLPIAIGRGEIVKEQIRSDRKDYPNTKYSIPLLARRIPEQKLPSVPDIRLH